jgi:ribose transport system ATP-binding protein
MNQFNSTTHVPLIIMKGIVKRFPGVIALNQVDFELLPGEVHVLLGENGAGKSTLIKVLSGAFPADSGEIFIFGEKVTIESPEVPLKKGLRFIYQELNLVPQIDIARNIFLGVEPLGIRKLGIINTSTLYKTASQLLERFNIQLDPHRIVSTLSVTQQKMVEIARALVTDARVIVLDEPTDVLESTSRNDLFKVINHLKKEGVGFIYISHRYAEVYELGDRVTILRDGKNVGTFSIRDLTLETMIEKMIGGKIGKQYPSLPTPQEKIILRLENFQKGTAVLGIDFMLRKGEILGITGLMGAGKTELARAIAGVDPPTSGNLYIEDKKVTVRTPEEAIRHGISFLTENRKTEGVILDQSLRNNYGLPNINRLSPFGLVKIKKMNDEIDFYMKELTIKAPHRFTLAGQLSGGNQQKLVLAKWLGTHAKVILFDEPTRGIDIIGRREVYRIMQELLAEGTSIIMFTSDYVEAMEMSHRVMVMRRGKIVKEFPRNTASEDDILKAAIGVGEFH